MDWTGLAAVITALGVFYQIVMTTRRDRRVEAKVDDVHAEVRTANGIAVGLLAERAEGRRIEADVPTADRTVSEQGYVERLNSPVDAEGDPPPVG